MSGKKWNPECFFKVIFLHLKAELLSWEKKKKKKKCTLSQFLSLPEGKQYRIDEFGLWEMLRACLNFWTVWNMVLNVSAFWSKDHDYGCSKALIYVSLLPGTSPICWVALQGLSMFLSPWHTGSWGQSSNLICQPSKQCSRFVYLRKTRSNLSLGRSLDFKDRRKHDLWQSHCTREIKVIGFKWYWHAPEHANSKIQKQSCKIDQKSV